MSIQQVQVFLCAFELHVCKHALVIACTTVLNQKVEKGSFLQEEIVVGLHLLDQIGFGHGLEYLSNAAQLSCQCKGVAEPI